MFLYKTISSRDISSMRYNYFWYPTPFLPRRPAAVVPIWYGTHPWHIWLLGQCHVPYFNSASYIVRVSPGIFERVFVAFGFRVYNCSHFWELYFGIIFTLFFWSSSESIYDYVGITLFWIFVLDFSFCINALLWCGCCCCSGCIIRFYHVL